MSFKKIHSNRTHFVNFISAKLRSQSHLLLSISCNNTCTDNLRSLLSHGRKKVKDLRYNYFLKGQKFLAGSIKYEQYSGINISESEIKIQTDICSQFHLLNVSQGVVMVCCLDLPHKSKLGITPFSTSLCSSYKVLEKWTPPFLSVFCSQESSQLMLVMSDVLYMHLYQTANCTVSTINFTS